ncbi:DUF4249 domain-containing protein [Maribellus maritimus]|uniref:DUF4249 domain-containing protein n=1 Tax=Maribellus maritimus TaxID=2870838 RepID=UPI001EE9D79C|nr:DUF4249 domain-containing protein [Maribellus maritimus]MCG6188197.1 DUF4249 domain-containing protein [Maribellus maritimus]
MKKKSFLIILGFWILFSSCEEEVTLDFDNEPKLCLNCILNPDSVVSAKLTLSHRLDNSGKFETVDNGNLTLYEGNELFGIFEPQGNGRYLINKRPVEGKTYKIIAEAGSYNTISATTILPDFPVVEYSKEIIGHASYDSTLDVYNLNVQLKDKPGKDNYWIYENNVVSGVKYGGGGREINTLFIDDFNKEIDTEVKYGFTLFLGVRLSDEGYDGQSMDFVISDFIEATEYRYTEAVHFLNADEHYDKYIKTSILNRIKETSDLPFFEPVQMYSNIQNGYGIFGSCAITSVKL